MADLKMRSNILGKSVAVPKLERKKKQLHPTPSCKQQNSFEVMLQTLKPKAVHHF